MIIALALAAVINTCEWQAPRGLSPLMTPFDEVIEQFTDIPSDVRKALIADVRANRFTDQVTIRKSGITGKGGSEYANLRQMNFSNGKRCNIVTMKTWTELDMETALIYSAKGKDGTLYSLLRPEVCKNWSMITQTKEPTPPLRLLPPPAKLPPDPQPAEVTPLPVFAAAPIPPIIVPGVPDVPTTFSAEGSPDPMPRDSYPEPVTAALSFYDLTQWRPLLPRLARLFTPPDAVAPGPVVSLPVANPAPVPGVVPPTVPEPFPLPPVIGTAVLVPCTGVQLTLPATPAEIAALCPTNVPSGAPVDLPERAGEAVAPVPEMSTWALMLGGLLGVAFMTRRRA